MSPEIGECQACPSCGDRSEPEQDGDILYWACACGMEFGHQRVAQQEEGCQLGIPEGVRLAAGGIVPNDPGPSGDSVPVFLTGDCRIPLRPGA